MSERLFVFIGGSDAQNGDYSNIHKLARSGGTMHWSSIKDAQPGDRVLIYVREPHSAVIAEARVLEPAVKGKKGGWNYTALIGDFRRLSKPLSLKELKKAFPRWLWLKYPRGKANVPPAVADRLLDMVGARTSATQILITNGSSGPGILRQAAAKGSRSYWYAPKHTGKGDFVLFYAATPVSSIIAIGTAMGAPRPTNEKWYEVLVGNIQMLEHPIALDELRAMFPKWRWLKKVNMFSYVTPAQGRALLERCGTKPRAYAQRGRGNGAGFGTSQSNREVEQAAIAIVTKHLRAQKFRVQSRELDRIGYDLDAIRGRTELHVEVKGISGDGLRFPITKAEIERAETDPNFRLIAVTRARTSQPQIQEMDGTKLIQQFRLTPLTFLASKK